MQQGVPAREPGLYATADRVMWLMDENNMLLDACKTWPGFGPYAAWVLRWMSGQGMPQEPSPREPDFELPLDRS